MDWTPVISTILGAVIGVGSTLLVDRSRSRRLRDQQWEDLKRASYVEFLVAVNHTQQALCSVSYERDASRDVRAANARDAFRSNGIYAACEQVMIVAPNAVRIAANGTFDRLSKFRDRLDVGEINGDQCRAELDDLRHVGNELRDLMHDDLRRAGRRGAQWRRVRSTSVQLGDRRAAETAVLAG